MLFPVVKRGQLLLHLGADDESLRALLGGAPPHARNGGQPVLAFTQIRLGNVGGVNDGLCRQKKQLVYLCFFLRVKRNAAGGFSLAQRRVNLVQRPDLRGVGPVPLVEQCFCLFQTGLYRFEVGKHELQIYCVHIRHRVDFVGYVRHVRVLKASDDVNYRVNLPYVA